MTKVRKAVIPAAGYGTGFFPATKASSKELLPIVDKPIIQFIVEEAFDSGIEEILIITGKQKRSIEDHFDSNYELEQNLAENGKKALLNIVKSTTREGLYFVRQSYPLGLGDAILHAKAFVANEPFAVLLGDNITEGDIPATKQLIDLYEEHQSACVAVVEMENTPEKKYGFAQIESDQESDGTVLSVKSFIEKPSKAEQPSNLVIAGRYILTPDIFEVLESLKPGVDEEIQLTDAINQLSQTNKVLAKVIEGERFDVGDKLGYLEYSLQYGLRHPETSQDLKKYLIELVKQLKQ